MMTLARIVKRSLNWGILPCNTYLCSGLDWREQLELESELQGFLLANHEKRSNMHFKKALNLSKSSGYLKKKQQTLGMCALFCWDCTPEQAWRFCQGLGRCCSACGQWGSCCGVGVLPGCACPCCAPFQGVLIYLSSHSRQAFIWLFSYCLTWAICLERRGDLGFGGNITALGYGWIAFNFFLCNVGFRPELYETTPLIQHLIWEKRLTFTLFANKNKRFKMRLFICAVTCR